MAISDPAFAAQLQTADGRILDFDDPGCLLTYLAQHTPRVHAVYFHAVDSDRWIPEADVAFVPVQHTPMAYNLGAVPKGTPGAITYAEAVRQVLRRPRRGDD